MAEQKRISTAEAARRLGVKPETVYAYVSRGQLTRERLPGARGSTFDPEEVEALRSGRRGAPPAASPPDSPFALSTAITLIEDDRCSFRGVDACELARHHRFEACAEWLWSGELLPGRRFAAPPALQRVGARAVDALPPGASPVDRLHAATVAVAAADPTRFDLTPGTVRVTAARLIAVLVDALPQRGAATGGIARRMWSRLTRVEPEAPQVVALNAAMVLLMDHDLAVSTLAARVAASARAHPYAVVSAGLGALDGPLHGAASGLAHRMLVEVRERGNAGAVVADYVREGRSIPGTGHAVYPGEDPRAACLFGLLEAAGSPLVEPAREVVAAASRHRPAAANVDLALAALTVGAGMEPEAGEAIFAVARIAGWIAHALEEYEARPLRLRPKGRYVGPPPGRPVP